MMYQLNEYGWIVNAQRNDNGMLFLPIDVNIYTPKYWGFRSKGIEVNKLRAIKQINIMIYKVFLLLLLLPSIAFSDDFFTNPRWDGYISQSIIYTSDNNFFGDSDDDINLDYTEIELLFSTAFLRDFQFSGSLLSRRAGDTDNGRIRLDHGFITYTAFNNVDWTLGARAGRIKAPQGFYNETRDVAFTRPGILVPQSIYLERYRDWMFSADGIEFFTMRNWDASSLSFRLLMSNKDPKRKVFEELIGFDGYPIGDVKDGKSGLAKLLYDYNTGRLRLGLTYGYLAYDVDNTEFGGFPDSEISTKAVFISAEYNTDKWKFVGEYVPTKNHVKNLLATLPDQKTDGLSYYLQSTYRINPSWDMMLRRGVLYLNKDDKTGARFEADNPLLGIPGHTRYAKNWVLGFGWHFSDSLLFRIEYYDVEGTGWMPNKDIRRSSETSLHKNWEMVMFQTSYRF